MKETLTAYVKKLGLDKMEITLWPKKDGANQSSSDPLANEPTATITLSSSDAPKKKNAALDLIGRLASKSADQEDTSSSLIKPLLDSVGVLGDYHFPSDLLGGCCPRIFGEEESIVWNAAAEACDTERVHVVWQSFENKIWYLAARSNELAANPGSWCPFASVLPGMKDATALPVCYTYYSEDTATMMSLSNDGLQIYRGTTLVVRAKAERTARELGNAPIIDLVPDRIVRLSPAPWYSVSLFEDQARRILATLAVVGAIGFAGIAFVVWLLASMSLMASKHNVSSVEDRTKSKTMELMDMTQKLRVSPLHKQLADFADLNDKLLAVNGFLEVYAIESGRTRWRAVVPGNVTADRITDMGGKNIEAVPSGLAIGNAAEVEYEASAAGRK